MGNYIKHIETGKVIKIGKMDEAFYSRNTLLDFKKNGYIGFCNEQFNDELDEILNDEETLYCFNDDSEFIEWELENKVFYLPAEGLSHKKVDLHHNTYKYEVDCQEEGRKIIKAIMVGERYEAGKLRTIFKCNCCSKLFTIDHVTAMLLRTLLPSFKQYFNSKYAVCEDDLSIIETLEIFADSYTYEDMVLLTKNTDLKMFKNYIMKYNYKNLWLFYQDFQIMKEKTEKLLKGEVNIEDNE